MIEWNFEQHIFSLLIVKSFTIKQRFTTCSLASFINTRAVLSVHRAWVQSILFPLGLARDFSADGSSMALETMAPAIDASRIPLGFIGSGWFSCRFCSSGPSGAGRVFLGSLAVAEKAAISARAAASSAVKVTRVSSRAAFVASAALARACWAVATGSC